MSKEIHLPVLADSKPHDDVLPPLYARWIGQLLERPIPREENATCLDCAMVPPKDAPPTVGGTWFDPNTKCCTYLPELPNFLVGHILDDDDAQMARGRASLEARLAARRGVTPLGIFQSSSFRLVFRNTISGFGRSHSLRCPHYIDENGGLCGIYNYREATCATWYCKHNRGAVSKAFWSRLHQTLGASERAVARHCALELGIEPESLRQLFPYTSARDHEEAVDANDIDARADNDVYAAQWGKWMGREQEYFRGAGEIVRGMDWKHVVAAGGSELAVYAALLRQACATVSEEVLPERCIPGSFQIIGISPEMYRVQSYSFLDPLEVPRPMFESLSLFDGRPTRDAIRAMTEKVGVDISDLAIQRLLDFRILVPLEFLPAEAP